MPNGASQLMELVTSKDEILLTSGKLNPLFGSVYVEYETNGLCEMNRRSQGTPSARGPNPAIAGFVASNVSAPGWPLSSSTAADRLTSKSPFGTHRKVARAALASSPPSVPSLQLPP